MMTLQPTLLLTIALMKPHLAPPPAPKPQLQNLLALTTHSLLTLSRDSRNTTPDAVEALQELNPLPDLMNSTQKKILLFYLIFI